MFYCYFGINKSWGINQENPITQYQQKALFGRIDVFFNVQVKAADYKQGTETSANNVTYTITNL